MTAPNRNLAGQVTQDVRRTAHQKYFLRNGKNGRTKNMIAYLYGLAANRHGQVAHAPNGSALGVP